MTRKEHNGWTNYETWLVKLWMDNEQSSQEYWHSKAIAMFGRAEASKAFSKSDRARLDLADGIKEEHEESADGALQRNGWIVDLVNAALSEVNWIEIADSILASAIPTDTTQDIPYESMEKAVKS